MIARSRGPAPRAGPPRPTPAPASAPGATRLGPATTPRRPRGERGAGTLLVVAMTGVLLFVGLALAGVAAVVLAQRTAQAAADLAALAAAGAVRSGADGCAAAEEVARANRARVEGCAVSGRTATITVLVRGPTLLSRPVDVTAQARAGPG